jgi:hypothetical protein
VLAISTVLCILDPNGGDGAAMDPRARVFPFDGETWTVREQLAPPDWVPTLVFNTDLRARRVRSYPDAWYDLTVRELNDLA